MSKRIVFESEEFPGCFGIMYDGGLEYESDTFDSREEAQAIADAHDAGARSYEEACAMIEAAAQSAQPIPPSGMAWRCGFLVHENEAKQIDEIMQRHDSRSEST